MKRIAACLALTFCAGAAAPPPQVNYNAFGIAALQRLSAQSKTENVFISPVSIGVALAMTAEGARNATQRAMLHTLGVSGEHLDAANAALITSLRNNADASVGIANALWTRSDVKPSTQFVQLLAQRYGAKAQAVQFGNPSAADAINAWTKERTLGLIDRIVEQTTPADFVYLTNALAFKGTWTLQFKKSNTHPMPFTNADGTKSTVQMMSQTGGFATYDGANFSALRIPYGKGGYAAYILLPSGHDVDALIKTLGATTFDTIARGAQQSPVAVSVPRFTAQYRASLVPLLRAMGMDIAFTGSADFSGIHPPPPPLAITSVNHASYVRVDEEGTTAAAATSVGVSVLAILRPGKTFVVDRPFVLALRDEHTGSLLFAGAIRTLKE